MSLLFYLPYPFNPEPANISTAPRCRLDSGSNDSDALERCGNGCPAPLCALGPSVGRSLPSNRGISSDEFLFSA